MLWYMYSKYDFTYDINVWRSCDNHVTTDDVAVVDEVQMIEDPERGGAWTRALLGE